MSSRLPSKIAAREFRVAAAERAEKALQVYEDIIDSDKTSWEQKMRAADRILDRAFGKPTTVIEETIHEGDDLNDRLEAAANKAREIMPSKEPPRATGTADVVTLRPKRRHLKE